MNRRDFIATGLAASLPRIASGGTAKLRRLCVLGQDDGSWAAENLPHLLRELGAFDFHEGRNLETRVCAAEARNLTIEQCAAEVARSGCDVIFTENTLNTRALQRATRTVPIVTGVGDPVGSGFAASLARPGGNITGLSFGIAESASKLLELALRVVAPQRSLALLGDAELPPETTRPMEAAARKRGVEPRVVQVQSLPAAERELGAMRIRGERMAIVYLIGFADGAPEAIVEMAMRNGIALVSPFPGWPRLGGLLSHAAVFRNQRARSAAQIALILRGARAGDIPFELPESNEVIVNRTTASKLGLIVPQDLLILATEVIGPPQTRAGRKAP